MSQEVIEQQIGQFGYFQIQNSLGKNKYHLYVTEATIGESLLNLDFFGGGTYWLNCTKVSHDYVTKEILFLSSCGQEAQVEIQH